MADNTTVHFGENSPEQVAYKLMRDIVAAEDRSFGASKANRIDRKWLLDTYGECLQAVKGFRAWDD